MFNAWLDTMIYDEDDDDADDAYYDDNDYGDVSLVGLAAYDFSRATEPCDDLHYAPYSDLRYAPCDDLHYHAVPTVQRNTSPFRGTTGPFWELTVPRCYHDRNILCLALAFRHRFEDDLVPLRLTNVSLISSIL